MLFEDTGNGALIQLTDEEVYKLRLAIRRLQEWHEAPDGTNEFILPNPDEAALAYELKEKLYEVPLIQEAFLDKPLSRPGTPRSVGEPAPTVSFRIRRRDLE